MPSTSTPHHLRTFGEPMLPHGGLLWIVRVVLLAAVLLHASPAITLWRRTRRRAGYVGGKRYQTKQNRKGIQRSYASFTMRWGGVTLALFIVCHMLNLTTQRHPSRRGVRQPVRAAASTASELFWVLLAYTIALIAVGFHLWHGFWSAFTTLGRTTAPRARRLVLEFRAIFVAMVITAGFLAPAVRHLLLRLGEDDMTTNVS